MKVLIFLDFDGVISDIKDGRLFELIDSRAERCSLFNKENYTLSLFSTIGMCNLRSLLETDPDIKFDLVWISSHRLNIDSDRPMGLFTAVEVLFKECIPGIEHMFKGITPKLNPLTYKRCDEVKEYMKENNINKNSYDRIILIDDDEKQENYPDFVKVFKTNYLDGLDFNMLEDIRNYLRSPK